MCYFWPIDKLAKITQTLHSSNVFLMQEDIKMGILYLHPRCENVCFQITSMVNILQIVLCHPNIRQNL